MADLSKSFEIDKNGLSFESGCSILSGSGHPSSITVTGRACFYLRSNKELWFNPGDGSGWGLADSSLAQAVAGEASRAQAAESSLSSSINSEISRAAAAEASLSSVISNETSRAVAAETSLSSALSSFIAQKGAANGLASLGSDGRVPSGQLPSYVSSIATYSNLASFPGTGSSDTIYVATDTNKQYRWSGSAYIEVSPSGVSSVNGMTGTVVVDTDDVTEGTSNLYYTAARVANKLTKGSKTIICIDNGDYATGQAAIDAASSGDSILFGAKSGGWGDLVLPSSKRLTLMGLQPAHGLAVLVGTITFSPTTGTATDNTVYIDNLYIQSSAGSVVTVGGTAPVRARFKNCYIYAGTTNQTAVLSNTQTGSSVYFHHCWFNCNGTTATLISSSTPYVQIYWCTVDNGGKSMQVSAGLVESNQTVWTCTTSNEVIGVSTGATFNSSSSLFNNSTTNGSGILVSTAGVYSSSGNIYNIATGTGYCVRGTGYHIYGSMLFNNSAAAAGNVKVQNTLTNLPFTTTFTSSS